MDEKLSIEYPFEVALIIARLKDLSPEKECLTFRDILHANSISVLNQCGLEVVRKNSHTYKVTRTLDKARPAYQALKSYFETDAVSIF